jgi:Rrf2 family transcriptional regulator, cysteine metabolism repressor
MKLSTRCRYGTLAMLEIARNYKKGPVKRTDIAKTEGISPAYLENILISLKTQNLIRTVRGANGGFTLETSPENINMFQIMTALEEFIAPVHCAKNNAGCGHKENCIARKFWLDFHDMQVKSLKAASLQSLLDLEDSGKESDYCI